MDCLSHNVKGIVEWADTIWYEKIPSWCKLTDTLPMKHKQRFESVNSLK